MQCLVTRTLNKQAELPLKIDKGLESVLMRVQEISIRKHVLGASIFENPHAKSMKDFIQFFG
ncbi:hypothetical protein CBR56_08725 [Bacillus thuringiensis]|nr:hypothetical protein BK728_21920 [Bacillus thuringiensis serovar chanpaisis]PNK30706.1 hypothetical protein CBR56_08725 [Bacillus thuringiensis]